jgi:hypothetical protein
VSQKAVISLTTLWTPQFSSSPCVFCVKRNGFLNFMNWIFRKLGHTANCTSDPSEGGGGCLYYESDICSAAQDFPRHLLTITIRYRVQYMLLLNCIMNQKTSAFVLSSHMSKAYFKISSLLRLVLPGLNFSEVSRNKVSRSHECHISPTSSFLI